MAAGVRTRNKKSSHLSHYLGSGRELLKSELPTLRDALRYGVLIRQTSEKNQRTYTNKDIASDMTEAVLAQYTLANAQFKPPVITSQKKIRERLLANWEKASDISLGRGKLAVKDSFARQLDQLFDVITCRCPIFLCAEFGCDRDCKSEAHISCSCKRELKIPVIELAFVKAQREKTGSLGAVMISSQDIPESKRQETATERQKRRRVAEEKRLEKAQSEMRKAYDRNQADSEFNDFPMADPSADQENDDFVPNPENNYPKPFRDKIRNRKDISNIALASMRHHTGLRETAEIATAAWIDGGLITPDDVHLVIDHNKVRRAQEKLVSNLEEEFRKKIIENGVSCLFFDGRRDDTKVFVKVGDADKLFPAMVKEEHYTCCSEPGGKYLWHFTPEKDDIKKPAEIVADNIVNWLRERNVDQALQAIGGDSTNMNTGWQGGVMQWIERKIGRKLVWIVCDLHTNELPLRHLIQELDGKTLSNNGWSGPLGKMLDSATELEINPSFEKITVGPPFVELAHDMIDDLSTDQYYGYMIGNAIRTGLMPDRLPYLQIGPVSHSRWLTTALRFCRIWVAHHKLKGNRLHNLRLIVQFIVGVYLPNWFNTKVKSSFSEGPRHVLFQLELLRSQPRKVVQILEQTVRKSSWYAHPEAVLQTMLCSKNEEERRVAVKKILDMRLMRGSGHDKSVGDDSFRVRKTPEINLDAKTLTDLIDLDSIQAGSEPPLTCSLTNVQVRAFLDNPMYVPAWPSHTQSIERCVQQVSEASSHVYNQERREGYIRAQVVSREVMSRNRSKKDMISMVCSNTGS